MSYWTTWIDGIVRWNINQGMNLWAIYQFGKYTDTLMLAVVSSSFKFLSLSQE